MILGSNSAAIGIYPLQLASIYDTSLWKINPKSEARNPKQIRNTNFQMFKTKAIRPADNSFGHLKLGTRPQGGESAGPILKI
jgi:hypothetical protein